MKRALCAAVALLTASLVTACVPPQPLPVSTYGQIYLPAANGARVDAMAADCLVAGDPCPPPVTLSLYPEEWNVASLNWTPDGAAAAVLATDEPKDHLALFIPPSRQLRRFASLAFVRETAWSPDSKLLAVVGVAEHGQKSAATTQGQIEGSNIFLYSVAGKELGNLTTGLPGMKSNLGWLSPDTLLFQNYRAPDDCNVYALTISSGAIAPWPATPLCDASPAVSPDGTQVAYVHDDNLFLADSGAANAVEILDLPAAIASPNWSLDGQWISFDESEPLAAGVVHPDGSDYAQVGENVHSAGFAPLVDKALLLTADIQAAGAAYATASWFVTPVPDGSASAVVVPGIPPTKMPLGLSWRPPER